jgi:hypothetical protein
MLLKPDFVNTGQQIIITFGQVHFRSMTPTNISLFAVLGLVL